MTKEAAKALAIELQREYWGPRTDPARRREIMKQVKSDPVLLVAWDEQHRGMRFQ